MQYGIDAGILEEIEPDRKLYLAVGKSVYEELAQMKMFTMIVKRFQIALLVASLEKEEILQWNP